MAWSTMSRDQKFAAIERGISEGKTAAQMGADNSCSRGAIIGQANRFGLQLGRKRGRTRKATTPVKPKTDSRKKPVQNKAKPAAPKLEPQVEKTKWRGFSPDEKKQYIRQSVANGMSADAMAWDCGATALTIRRYATASGITIRVAGALVSPALPPEKIFDVLEGTSPKILKDLPNYRACRFPVGKAIGAEQLYCATTIDRDKTYCSHHKSIMFTTPRTRRKRTHV